MNIFVHKLDCHKVRSVPPTFFDQVWSAWAKFVLRDYITSQFECLHSKQKAIGPMLAHAVVRGPPAADASSMAFAYWVLLLKKFALRRWPILFSFLYKYILVNIFLVCVYFPPQKYIYLPCLEISSLIVRCSKQWQNNVGGVLIKIYHYKIISVLGNLTRDCLDDNN